MTEFEARAMARAELRAMGSPRDWHKPYIRFAPGTALTFHDPTQREYRLAPGDAVYIDLGPVWPSGDGALEYEGDVGATFAFGENPEVEACVATARRLFEETAEAWRLGALSGEALYGFLAEQVAETEYQLDPRVEGHRVADYPHSRYTTAPLKRLPFAPTPWLWVLEVHIAYRSGRFLRRVFRGRASLGAWPRSRHPRHRSPPRPPGAAPALPGLASSRERLRSLRGPGHRWGVSAEKEGDARYTP
jgi:hypothetical protein